VNLNIKKSVTNTFFFMTTQNIPCNKHDMSICLFFSFILKKKCNKLDYVYLTINIINKKKKIIIDTLR